MKITKLTQPYVLINQNGKHILNFGTIKQKTPVVSRLRFEDIDANNFNLKVTCGCSAVEKQAISNSLLEYNITYNAAALGNFDKTLVITDKNNRTELKLTGTTIQ